MLKIILVTVNNTINNVLVKHLNYIETVKEA